MARKWPLLLLHVPLCFSLCRPSRAAAAAESMGAGRVKNSRSMDGSEDAQKRAK